MPCTDYNDDWGKSKVNADTKARLDNVTHLLCELCSSIDKIGYETGIKYSKKLDKWWSAHKRIDAERIAHENKIKDDERKRAAALGKLTAEERKLLNLR